MTALWAAVWSELLKGRRSKAPIVTVLAFSLAPIVGAVFMLVLRDPEWARRTGLLNAKAQLLSGAADWGGYTDMLQQAIAIGGLLIFGLMVIWVFGREYSEHTAKDLLALPVSREAVVMAKFIVVAGWSLLLSALVGVEAFVLGNLLRLEGGSAALIWQTAATIAVVAGLTISLVTPFGWVASATHGYLSAVGAMFLVVFLTQVLAALGWGAYFPWAVPALVAGTAGPAYTQLGAESYALVGLAGISGLVGTAFWWRYADQV